MIIAIEGLPGSGKTSTARWLAGELQKQGLTGDWWHEGQLNHPIGLPWTYADARATVAATTPTTYPFDSWRSIPRAGHDFEIVEAKFLQSTSAFALFQGLDEETIASLPTRILKQINLDRFILIVLDVSDPREHLRQTVSARRKQYPDWIDFIREFFSEMPWCQKRGLQGEDAFVEALAEWHSVQSRLLETLACEQVKVFPELGWDEAHRAISEFVTAAMSRA